MSRLVWDTFEYEAGVDQGVLYFPEGVVWNGLISVDETPNQGMIKPYYVDGVKYLNHDILNDFQAIVEAYTYPDDLTPNKKFGFSYRTMIGEDDYKLHLVYDAQVEPILYTYKTHKHVEEALNFKWSIFTKAPILKSHRPSAHLVIDTRDTPIFLTERIEGVLYGTINTEPRLPPIREVIFMFQQDTATKLDAGYLGFEYFETKDAGRITESQTSTIDGGGP